MSKDTIDDLNTMFFVTGFYNKKEPETRMHNGRKYYSFEGKTRCVAFFSTLEEAKHLVEKRGSDIYECIYDYAVIEEMTESYFTFSRAEYWYKAMPEKDDPYEATYVPIEKPEFLKNVCSFAIG